MQVQDLRNYGVAFSDAEGGWPADVKKNLQVKGREVVFGSLGLWEKLRLMLAFLLARWRARSIDLTVPLSRGLDNKAFLKQQSDYLCLFVALTRLVGTPRAIDIMRRVMDATADALLLCLPEADDVRTFEDPFEVIQTYMATGPEAARLAGCHELTLVDEGPNRFGFDITWCIWLELARAYGVPDACGPECYCDDLVFPSYFESIGIRYERTETLGTGGKRCDFRFERVPPLEV